MTVPSTATLGKKGMCPDKQQEIDVFLLPVVQVNIMHSFMAKYAVSALLKVVFRK